MAELSIYGGLVGGCNKIVFLISCAYKCGGTKERSLKINSWMLLMLGWVGGKAKSSREPLLKKKRAENRTAQKKERKKVQQHMRQPWSDKSNFADLNWCRMTQSTANNMGNLPRSN
jgi:hypothetical protein